MMKFRKIYQNDVTVLLLRLLIPVAIVWLLRIVFYLYNADFVRIGNWSEELPALLKGSLIFDASNLSFTFGLFALMSLLPFKFRRRAGYQRFLKVIFLVFTVVLVVLNVADTIYFFYAQKRITVDELSYVENGNNGIILFKGIVENWYLILLAVTLIVASIWVYKKIRYYATDIVNKPLYYIVNTFLFVLVGGLLAVMIRGGVGRDIRPITLSNAAQFTDAPIKSYIVLNNPFCLIRTSSKNQLNYKKYYSENQLDSLFDNYRKNDTTEPLKKKNIVIFILESFSFEHSKYLNPQLYKGGENYTPFLDSLMQHGFIFDKCYSNGHKSIDALPSILASIPSFKTPFALTQQALAPMNGLGTLLGNEGWDSWFFNGSINRSMGFVAFAKSAGFRNFRTRENYIQTVGRDDFDGYWGIWDDMFLPYMARELNYAREPFVSAAFTLSSHHPFIIPDKYKNVVPKGHTRVQPCVAYADIALRKFFHTAETEKWYKNTIFVFVADHVSSEVYAPENKTGAGNFHIMYFMYTPDESIKGRTSVVTQQIDIMPTLLGMINYNKPYFAFGQDVLKEKPHEGFAVNYSGGAYQWITDSATYIFDETTTKHPLVDKKVKAFIQRYYLQMEKRKFVLDKHDKKME